MSFDASFCDIIRACLTIFFAIQIYVIFENQIDDANLYVKSSHLCSGSVVCCFFVDF